MEHTSSQLIDYFRRCYRADSYGISISDVSRLRSNRHLEINGHDELASGGLPKLPLVEANVEQLYTQTEKYKKERLLIYGCFFVRGKVTTTSGFSSSRTLNSPLIYFPAQIHPQDTSGAYYLSIDQSDLRVNRPLLRQLLKPDLDSAELESFPVVEWPLAMESVAQVSKWLRQHTVIVNLEELGRWPTLTASSDMTASDSAESSGDRITVRCACALLLAERAKGSRGVLHELGVLSQPGTVSSALSALLGQAHEVLSAPSATEPDLIPGLLSRPQLTALENAAKETVSLISGPPGTGKSYTIAAIAIDRMLHGESVLVVSKSEQAIKVVGEKLNETFNLQQGYVHTTQRNFQTSMKEYLDALLSMGVASRVNPERIHRQLTDVKRELDGVSQTFQKQLNWSRWISGRLAQSSQRSGVWGRMLNGVLSWLSARKDPAVLWRSPEEIGTLQERRESLCADYINAYRVQQLDTLLNTRRGEVTKFLQALKARDSKMQEERFAQTNIGDVLGAFPIWLVNVNELNRVLPLQAELFDVVIFDEATQCDIATSIPALQRAKRAVIVGDGKQLRHVSFVSRREQQSIFDYCRLNPAYAQQYNYREQSLLDLASDTIQKQTAVCLLDEYYRGKTDLISFSNRYFYQDRLKVMRSRPGELIEPALSFTQVEGERTRTGRNSEESRQVIQHIESFVEKYADSGLKPSIGVLSPFREQAQYLEKTIASTFSESDIQAHKIRVDTPYGFQGEERDLMLLSMAIDENSARAAAYLNREDMFNVAVTRAKERMHVYHSVAATTLARDNLFRRYLEHNHLQASEGRANQARCEFAETLSAALVQEGYQCWQGFEVAGVEIDVLCQKQGQLLGIDLIGFPGDFHDSYDVETYKSLFRSGIRVLPMPYSVWLQQPEACLKMINDQLLSLMDGADR
ncbi:DEAD/DEAH box helicase [Litoribrevibacter albus]|uniref:AAA family ATPase n=1 Tax=Litoribrevibacter albus TaxID=1473156 RepID=A0AA37SB80_9GAMM|nr:AAA domain-containing protein [Litoribrevibacter albus]GLQ32797.1 hypothetical protein GCM10007876_32760 [Litoribrevibacter albus]